MVPGVMPGVGVAMTGAGVGGFVHQQQQQQQAQEQSLPEEQEADPERAKNILPIYGSSSTFNINTLLYNNIMEADYFKALYQLRTYHEIVGK
jgi:hypothetical protein